MVHVGGGGGQEVLHYFGCFRAVASPTKLYPKTKGYNFQELSMVVIVPLFSVLLVCSTFVIIWCPGILEIYFTCF